MHTAPYFSGFGILAIVLSVRVIRLRRRHRVSMGDGGVAELGRRMRVFGNFAEYAPLGLILLIALEFVQSPVWYMHLAGGTLLLGRVLHAIGLEHPEQPHPGRISGMTLTFLSFALSSLGLLVFAMRTPPV